MITRESVWASIDDIAKETSKSLPVLAKEADLDFSTLAPARRNKSWPSLKTVAKVLNSRGITLSEWAALVERKVTDEWGRPL